jgi:hypothetical protein
MTASALWESARDDSRATLEILYRMARATPPSTVVRQSAPPAIIATPSLAAPSIVRRCKERRRTRRCHGNLKIVAPAPTPAPARETISAPNAAALSFFSKPPAPRPIVASALSPAVALGMPRMARWLQTGAMLYAGSMTAALIAGTVLWPR